MRLFFFFKQKTAYEMRISDWSSYVCASDLAMCVGQRRLEDVDVSHVCHMLHDQHGPFVVENLAVANSRRKPVEGKQFVRVFRVSRVVHELDHSQLAI